MALTVIPSVLNFVSRLFRPRASPDLEPEAALIDSAIERVVDGTDRRLRALGSYRKRLREPVASSVEYVRALVDGFPTATEISGSAFGRDPTVRALFSSVEQLHAVLGNSRGLRDFLAAGPVTGDDAYALLVMDREARTVFGTELDGDTVRRDVIQKAVNFSLQRFLGVRGSEQESRIELKKRAFDYLIERALESLTDERLKREGMVQQRRLLRKKLEAMRAGRWGLAPLDCDDESPVSDGANLEDEIEAIDQELGRFAGSALDLDESLERVSSILWAAGDYLGVRDLRLHIDYRGLCVPESAATPDSDVQLIELFAASGLCRTVLFVRVPVGEIPERSDPLRKAAHYLA